MADPHAPPRLGAPLDGVATPRTNSALVYGPFALSWDEAGIVPRRAPDGAGAEPGQAFAPLAGRMPGMADRVLQQVTAAARRTAHGRRSDAYRWLRRQHASVAKLMAEHAPPMRALADEMAAAGIAGGRGRPLTAKAVARIWARVCRDVASAGAAKPSRSGPAGWTPRAVARPAECASGETQPRTRSGKGYDVWDEIDRRSGRR